MFINTGIATSPGTTTTKPGTINPVIKSLTANPTSLSQPGQSISIQVDAYDPKGENLRYTWSATGGTLSATTGTLVSWKAPNVPATYTVLVLVTNDSGGTSAGNLNIQVNSDGTSSVSNSTITNSGSSSSNTTPSDSLDWAFVSPGITFDDAFFVSPSAGWVVGDTYGAGQVRHTTDGGRTWQNQDIGDRTFTSVHFVTPNLGWVGGQDGRLYKTTDAGATWTPQTFGATYWIKGIHFSDQSNGLLVTSGNTNGGVYITSDGGTSWRQISKGLYSVLFGSTDGTRIILDFDSRKMKRVKDGGISEIDLPVCEYISTAPDAPSRILAIGNKERDIYLSENSGVSWKSVSYQITNGSIYESTKWYGGALLSDSEAIGLTNKGLLDTTDSCANWNILARDVSNEAESTDGYWDNRKSRLRFFAFDRRHAWQTFGDNTRLLRIGSI